MLSLSDPCNIMYKETVPYVNAWYINVDTVPSSESKTDPSEFG
jgi:hypothetical protein